MRPLPWRAGLGAVFALGFAVRLGSVLRGGGLTGILGYDDGVYYGSALALTGGHLPYRDFLLLHPPGIVLALTPFALFGRVTGSDLTGLVAARLAWMVLGAINGVLVARLLRPSGRFAALVGGFGYAVYFPAIQAERVPVLEGVGKTLLLGALLLLARIGPADRSTAVRSSAARPALLAGACLGAATTLKIWGVLAVVVLVGWLLFRRRGRAALLTAAGAAGAAVAICLPFFLATPRAMWRMVVLDQLGRPDNAPGPLARLALMLGAAEYPPPGGAAVVIVAGVAVIGLVTVAAGRRPLAVTTVLLPAYAALLLVVPSFYPHYAAVIAVPLMVALGTAAGLFRRRAGRGLTPSAVTAVAVTGILALLGAAWPGLSVGRTMPTAELAAVVRDRPGCVAADQPTVLIALNAFSRNLDRGCPVVVDLDGSTYDLRPKLSGGRGTDPRFRRLAFDYLAGGDTCLITRYQASFGLSEATEAQVDSWPVIAQAGRYVLRAPPSMRP